MRSSACRTAGSTWSSRTDTSSTSETQSSRCCTRPGTPAATAASFCPKRKSLGDTKLQVLHTPGHSRGHCCFLLPEEKIVFLSDIDLTSFGPWYGALDSNVDDFIDSIEKLKRMSFEIAVTSHKGEVFR
ncbi:MAG: MBL fold metallo-hydrolase [Candidatus Freyarchaeota archaeon]